MQTIKVLDDLLKPMQVKTILHTYVILFIISTISLSASSPSSFAKTAPSPRVCMSVRSVLLMDNEVLA